MTYDRVGGYYEDGVILLFVHDNYRLGFSCVQSKLKTTPRVAKSVVIANGQ
jgi:hypothetical protein